MRIGFIGIGGMGLGMARSLLRAGHEVSVYNRTRSRAEPLADDGAQVVDDVADACHNDLVISMLADDPAVEDIVFGHAQFLHALPGSAVHVSMATISATLAEKLTRVHEAAGRRYISAPVFGRPEAAATGKLFIVAAGPPEAVAKCQPAFDVMGQRTFVVGEDPVTANIVKISGNFMLASLIETLGEAFALTRRYDIDPGEFLEILTNTIFPAPVYKTYGGMIAGEKYDPPGFRLSLGLKDVRLALEAADRVTVPMPIASLLRDRLLTGMARGYEDLDWSALGRVCADDAGL